jgi:hypothetical protein
MKKLSLLNTQGTLNRSEMKKIMAGSDGVCTMAPCRNIGDCGNTSGCHACRYGYCGTY